jgi:hypothetical protein
VSPIVLSDFPPPDLASFLRFCAGEWLTVRSRFNLDAAAAQSGTEQLSPPAGTGPALEAAAEPVQGPFPTSDVAEASQLELPEQRWHDSDRGSLLVTYLEPAIACDPGGLAITPPAAAGRPASHHQLQFGSGGMFKGHGSGGEQLVEGRWQLGGDGALELTQLGELAVVKERIWFIKPNLRLRSCVQRRLDGQPLRASFSSEIRRLNRPAP